MNLSMRWLKEFVPLDEMPIRDFTEAVTMSGSKVESWEREGSEISNVVVGKVVSLEQHPDSDHLWITKTDVGEGEPLQIVTGAQNLKVGDVVPVALHNSMLPGGKKIKKGKLRGMESNGMLCSLGELGLTKHDFPYAIEDGIFVLQEDCKLGAADLRGSWLQRHENRIRNYEQPAGLLLRHRPCAGSCGDLSQAAESAHTCRQRRARLLLRPDRRKGGSARTSAPCIRPAS